MTKKNIASINIIIADDHGVVREGLRQICSDNKDLILVGQADNGLDAIKLCRTAKADVLILDISLPDRTGIEVLKQVKKEFPDLPVLILSIHREDQYAIRSLKAGAAGFLNKQSATEELVTAVRQIAGGRKYVSSSLAQELANQIGQDHEQPAHEMLSDREYQTLIMIASGKTVSDIAAELVLSVKTISMYRARILLKMKLRHNAELTHYAISHQLTE
ncbi:response regulator transcription factor [Herbaspirillum sp. RTI4]|uniref:response regulator transcription factor n=1 Tax=Herbaspirillum sp. RTI4 TaxID=3048640 RepID=UPI002AB57131|nr:response regulator transcription factor [Herbaspirillum sp. RTI4]MDY7579178.1 response regulator transcription factor [Herbaspirillum sp. RTI4]MEA9983226.1 response regulator transcription factor [Herbaspirillum sp. RTI4]